MKRRTTPDRGTLAIIAYLAGLLFINALNANHNILLICADIGTAAILAAAGIFNGEVDG